MLLALCLQKFCTSFWTQIPAVAWKSPGCFKNSVALCDLQGSQKLSCSQKDIKKGTELTYHLEIFFSLVEKPNGQVYEQKSSLAMASAFSEIWDKYVKLVHVSFFAGIAQAQMKQ